MLIIESSYRSKFSTSHIFHYIFPNLYKRKQVSKKSRLYKIYVCIIHSRSCIVYLRAVEYVFLARSTHTYNESITRLRSSFTISFIHNVSMHKHIKVYVQRSWQYIHSLPSPFAPICVHFLARTENDSMNYCGLL